jgi:PAS domain S-box-containing protein
VLLDILLSVSPIVNSDGRVVGASKIARDITGRKLAHEKLRQSEERFRTMADSSPTMIWMTDPDGHTSFLNRTTLEYIGVAAAEVSGFDWSKIVHPEDREAYVAAFGAALQSRGTFHQRLRLRRRGGDWRWFEARGNPLLDSAGVMTGYIGSSLDITDIYESQQRLERA